MSDHLKPIIEALIFASPEPLTPKALYKLLDGEPKEDVDAALEAVDGRLRRGRAGCRSSRSPAATRSSRAPSCTNGCASCSTSGRRRSCRCSRSRRWRSSPTSSRSPRRRSPRSAASRSSGGVLSTLVERKLDQDRRPQAGRRPSVHVRHDARVPRALRAERPQRSAEGRGDVRRARLRAAQRIARADDGPSALPFEDVEATDKTVH